VTAPKPLPPELLCCRCAPATLPFETTAELEPLAEAIGQARAAEAVRFGFGIDAQGYNLFAMGPTEMGKDTLVRGFIEERAAGEPVPDDVAYVNNFDAPQRARALRLPAGQGQALRRDVAQLVDELRTALPAAFESEEFANRKQVIEAEVKERHEKLVLELRKRAQERGVALLRTPMGFAIAPVKDGEVLSPEEFERLPEEERKRLAQNIEATQAEMQELIEQVPRLERDVRAKVKALIRDVAVAAVGNLIDELKKRYAALPAVVAHLDAMQQDVLENVDDFLKPQEAAASEAALAELGVLGRRDRLRRYGVNVIVDHGGARGAPIVYEDHPTFLNLVGRIEHLAQFGALTTDFNLIKAGALHRANGGYLVLDARNLLLQPYAYEGLKRALRAREIRIESLGQMLSLASTVSLEPEPIPLDVKVVLLGERLLYYLLDQIDPELHALFKVIVDFEEDVPRGAEGQLLYARLVAQVTKRERLRAFDRGAVAAVIDRGARIAGDAERLSTHMGELADLFREADYWAGAEGRDVVLAEDVERAVLAQERRAGRVRQRVLEEIRRGTILIDTRGERVGQVNGLSVLSLGRSSFGRPTRITARTRLGKGEVIDIEREVQLGGPIHSKGVLILAGYLGARYATSHPLSLSATLVFEQSYGMVEGDSASCAELYALLSSLADAPLTQSLAVTGSVNQHGEVQAIGGVNEKIEGFFEVCRAAGLTGDQGVLIPAANVKHLMLSREVVEAARAGQFHVIPVRTIDEGIALLTGLPAGERDAAGAFPPDSVNGRVDARLIALAERRAALARAEAPSAGGGGDKP
jgi:lon-related putative ATP-dependent protease